MDSNINYDLLFNEHNSATANSYLPSSCNEIEPNNSKISMITEDQSTENFLKEFDTFYTEMMSKVNGIKNTPVLKNTTFPDDEDIDENKLFNNLKYTPEVLEQLESVKKLDDEINSVISQYKIEKEERLQTQYEMYNEITNNVMAERDTDLFLNLCRFEFTETDNIEKLPDKTEKKRENNKLNDKNNTFIQRNISLAKNAFGNYSLTDEEKFDLERLIQEEEEDNETTENPFKNQDLMKLEGIDSELAKIQLDEQNNEKGNKNEEPTRIMKELERLNDFLLQQRLKKIDAKLKSLREIDDKEKLEKIKLEKVDVCEDHEDVDDKKNNSSESEIEIASTSQPSLAGNIANIID